MKALIAITLLFSFAAQAEYKDITFICKRTSKSSCEVRTFKALEKLGCEPVLDSVTCRDAQTDKMTDPDYAHKLRGKDYCQVQSKCSSPKYGNFNDMYCQSQKPNKQNSVNLKAVDSNITLTTSLGIFQRMVRTLCK